MIDEVEMLRRMYERFNARDIDGVISAMSEDVEWANGLDGGYVQGKGAVRDYWSRQWAQVSPRVEPLSFEACGDDGIAVEVRQDLFHLSGRPLDIVGGLQSQIVRHVYRLRDSLVVRFDLDNGG